MGRRKIETINIENWERLQFIEFEVRNKIQCPKCYYKYDSFYCIGKQIEPALMRVCTQWKCTNGHCLHEVEYIRSTAVENKDLELPRGNDNFNS